MAPYDKRQGPRFWGGNDDVVYAGKISIQFYSDIERIRRKIRSLKNGGADDEPIRTDLLIKMVHSYTKRPGPGEGRRDMAREMLRVINVYDDRGLKAGNDIAFLKEFLQIMNEEFNILLNSTSETMQTRLRMYD